MECLDPAGTPAKSALGAYFEDHTDGGNTLKVSTEKLVNVYAISPVTDEGQTYPFSAYAKADHAANVIVKLRTSRSRNSARSERRHQRVRDGP